MVNILESKFKFGAINITALILFILIAIGLAVTAIISPAAAAALVLFAIGLFIVG